MGGGVNSIVADAAAPDRGAPSAKTYFPQQSTQGTLLEGKLPQNTSDELLTPATEKPVTANPPLRRGADDGIQFVGLLKEGDNPTVSTVTIGSSFDIQNRNYIQNLFVNNAGVWINDSYYAVLEFPLAGLYQIYKYDSSIGWANTAQGQAGEIHPHALAYDAATATTYGCFADATGSTFTLATLDVITGAKNDIAILPQKFPTLTFDKQGTLYGVGADGTLYTINPSTAAITPVGPTGITTTDFNSITFDNSGETLYWFVNNAVYTIDPASGTATWLMDFTGRTVAWAGVSPMPEKEAVVPSWIDELQVDFPKGSLTGQVRMKMPTKATSGVSLTGPITWHLLVDGIEQSGTSSAGAVVEVPLTLEKGMHDFVAYAEYEGTAGLEGSQKVYIGHDIPAAPGNPTVTEEGPGAFVTWQPVTQGINGGYIDLDALTYTVTRDPGAVVVADATTSTSLTDNTISAMNYYTYRVTASDGTAVSETASSPTMLLGKGFGVQLPFSHTFDNNGFGLFIHNDANQDGITWQYSEGLVWFMINPNQDSDDWLISPPVHMEKGKHYNLRMNLMGSANMEIQRVELCYGKDVLPEAMTQKVKTELFRVQTTIDEWVVPQEDGDYYFGLQVVTPKTNGAICINDFYIGQGYNGEAPAAVTDLTVTPAPMGAREATVAFITPDKDFSGNPLGALSSVKVTNTVTGTVVKEFTNPGPGVSLEAIDASAINGNNSYTVVCLNDKGESLPAEAEAWVGMDLPGLPQNVRWSQEGTTARLTWEAPLTGAHGGYINTSDLSYLVSAGDSSDPLSEATKGFSMEFEPHFDNPQDVLQFNVWATNEIGAGIAARSNQSAFGTPYPAPLYESFEQASLHSTPWLVKNLQGQNPINVVTYVDGLADMEGNLITAYDEDGGMAVYTPLTSGTTRLELPITDISSLTRPVMKMWCFFIDDKTTVTVKANNNSGAEWTDIATFTKPAGLRGWNLVSVPLDKFKGENHLQLGIECSTPEYATYVLFDKMSIEEGHDIDLIMSGVDFPARIYAGKNFTTSVKVTNGGLKDSPQCEVQIFVDRKFAASVPLTSLPPCGTTEIEVEAFLSSNATSATVQAQVYCDGDEDPNNNAFASNIHVVRSSLPSPYELTDMSDSDSEIKLSWVAPVCSYNAPVTDSFEDLETGSVGGIDVKRGPDGKEIIVTQNVGQLGVYKLVDNDKLTTATVLPMMGTPNNQNGMVCQVVDVVDFNLRGTSAIWEAHSGNKLLAFWQSQRYDPALGADTNDDPNDDWLILPKLSENDKFISFWAKSLTDKYGLEQFEIMVSTETDDISDFERFTYATQVPAGYASSAERGYTYYEFDLPEETQYVAIRYNAAGTLALLLDDLTYTPDGVMTDVELLGYNIYRDDVRLNAEPLTTTEFTDTPDDAGTYTYNVTALFADGESPYSNTVTVAGYSAVGNVAAETSTGCDIHVEGSYIVIVTEAAATARVYSPDGMQLRTAEVSGQARIGMSPGVYIVKAGDVSRSVIIK